MQGSFNSEEEQGKVGQGHGDYAECSVLGLHFVPENGNGSEDDPANAEHDGIHRINDSDSEQDEDENGDLL